MSKRHVLSPAYALRPRILSQSWSLQIGDLTGATSWTKSGQQEHAAGETEIQAASAQGFIDGTLDRAQGKVDSVMGAITGDKERELHGEKVVLLPSPMGNNNTAQRKHSTRFRESAAGQKLA